MRRFARFRVDQPVRATVAGDSDVTKPIQGRCRVLGEGGLDAILAEELSPGDVVSLELSPWLKLHAAVRNRRSFHYGFEFIMLDDAQRSAIKRLCESYPHSRQI